MKFDIKETVTGMLAAVKGSVKNDWKEVKETTTRFLEMNKNRYAKLAEYRITGKIDQENFESRLKDEKLMLEAEFNTLAIISKVMAQNAANAAFGILEKAVKTAIGIGI
ncbi:MAG: hypothetical protein HQ522_22700 [Bacteroidetes bacterium]|nr:hypothetical protein [Bacteroidota bacterium]